MRVWVAQHAPLLASMGAAILLATGGLRTALAPKRRMAVCVLAAAGVLVAQALVYVRFTVDDSFITYRFARNWASGLGPVFQPGERVEGYTSFLHMALLALARRAGVEM